MSASIFERIRDLEIGLQFCGKSRRPVIQAMLDGLRAQLAELPILSTGSAATEQTEPPGDTGNTEGRPSEGCQAPPARRVDAERAVAPPCFPCPPDADWRARRLALRKAGHEVKQLDGVVYVDGRPTDDARLYA